LHANLKGLEVERSFAYSCAGLPERAACRAPHTFGVHSPPARACRGRPCCDLAHSCLHALLYAVTHFIHWTLHAHSYAHYHPCCLPDVLPFTPHRWPCPPAYTLLPHILTPFPCLRAGPGCRYLPHLSARLPRLVPRSAPLPPTHLCTAHRCPRTTSRAVLLCGTYAPRFCVLFSHLPSPFATFPHTRMPVLFIPRLTPAIPYCCGSRLPTSTRATTPLPAFMPNAGWCLGPPCLARCHGHTFPVRVPPVCYTRPRSARCRLFYPARPPPARLLRCYQHIILPMPD